MRVREAVPDQMSVLYSGILTEDAMADDLVDGATMLDSQPVADVMRGLARRHRVHVREPQGRLAALTATYAKRFRLPASGDPRSTER